MADQGKWFKLWISSLDDPDLGNLSLENWARWVRLGVYIKAHGKDGKIEFKAPAKALLSLFQCDTLEHAMSIIKLLPNCTLGERSFTVSPETNATVSLEIEFQNWFKYQGDFSSDRVRKFRDKKRHHETVQEEKRGDEKRQEETRSIPLAINSTVSNQKKQEEWFEKVWTFYPAKGRIGKKMALKHFLSSVKDIETAKQCAQAMDRYLTSKRVKEGFIQNAPTWFNNWQDWLHYVEEKNGTVNC